MTIPNLLTLIRFFLAPLFLGVFASTGAGGPLSAFLGEPAALALCIAIVALAEISDLLDGYLARRLKQVSDLGKILDPYADSTFHLTCYFAFATGAHGPWLPVWVVLLLFYREVLVEVLRKLGASRGIYIAAALSGKMKTFTQATVILLCLSLAFVASMPDRFGGPWIGSMSDLATPLAWVAVAITWVSGLDYAWRNRALLKASGGR